MAKNTEMLFPGFGTDNSGTVCFLDNGRQQKVIKDIPSSFMMKICRLFQFTGEAIEWKNYSYFYIWIIFFDRPDCRDKITIAAYKNYLLTFCCKSVSGKGYIYIGFLFFMSGSDYSTVIANQRFLLKSPKNYRDTQCLAGININSVSSGGLMTPFRNCCAVIERSNYVASSQEMMAISCVIKPAKRARKFFYGMVEVEAINNTDSFHANLNKKPRRGRRGGSGPLAC